MSKINILAASDDNYAQHLGVTLVSVFENTSQLENLYVKVIDGNISEENKQKLKQVSDKYKVPIELIPFSLENIEDYKIDGHISAAAYYRIFLPAFYKEGTDRVIYLDCDVIVNGDIADFYKLPLKDNIIGAVSEPGSSRVAEMSLKCGKSFNSGILLIDYKKWMANDVTQKCLDFIKNHPDKIVFHDQDTMNGVLDGIWEDLPETWNYTRVHVAHNKDWKRNNFQTPPPKLVHYTNNAKPWHYYSRNPYDFLYFKYLKLSPWKGFVPYHKTFVNVLKKNIKLTMRSMGIIDRL
ncbi:MAG: glycosyltransferase family 8 protein [Bacteroidales bacterium]|nr:glycosyltransferase family 8 protein [Bacteroidales bacterium]